MALQEGRPERLRLPLTRGRFNRSLGGSQTPPQAERPPSQKQILWLQIASFSLQPRWPPLHGLLLRSRDGLAAKRDAGTVQKALDVPNRPRKDLIGSSARFAVTPLCFLQVYNKVSVLKYWLRLSGEISGDERAATYHVNAITSYNILVTP